MRYRFFDAAETAALLPYGRLRDELAAVLRENSAGALHLEERVILPLPRGTLLAMPASDDRLSITKVVTVHPGNADKGQPTISGEVIVARADDGTRLGLLHGGTVTRRRTAAVSLLAARLMGAEAAAASTPAHMLVIGAGDQAIGHAEAFTEELAVSTVTIASRGQERAEALATALRARDVDADVVVPGTAAFMAAVERCDLVVTGTTSTQPVVTEGVRDGATIFAVGAYRADMAELSPAVVGGADRVVVDTLAGARHEAGDLIKAAANGAWSWDGAVTLLDLLTGAAVPSGDALGSAGTGAGRGGGYQVFKSVGHAMYDLAAARVALPAP